MVWLAMVESAASALWTLVVSVASSTGGSVCLQPARAKDLVQGDG